LNRGKNQQYEDNCLQTLLDSGIMGARKDELAAILKNNLLSLVRAQKCPTFTITQAYLGHNTLDLDGHSEREKIAFSALLKIGSYM
jgi:hypothetical protein